MDYYITKISLDLLGSHIKPKELSRNSFQSLNSAKAAYSTGTWKPQIYDNETLRITLATPRTYYKIGKLVFTSVTLNNEIDNIVISVVPIIRGFPFTITAAGGFLRSFTTSMSGHVSFQWNGNEIIARGIGENGSNPTGTFGKNTGSLLEFWIIGVDNA